MTQEVPLLAPLEGVVVLDCTKYLPFSYGSQLLGMLGAEVIKVEPPGGEHGRAMATTFAAVNGGKRSVTIDLRRARGAELLLGLVETADVLFESFRPGVMGGMGLSPAVLLARNRRLVVCSATGFGQDGPYRDRPGHDLNYLAVAGALIAEGGRPPRLPGLPVADMSTGVFAALSIVAALFTASRHGVGQHIDLSMTDVSLSVNALAVASALGGVVGLPWPEVPLGECPAYGVWETRDGRWIALGNIEPKFWRNLVKELGLDRFADDGLAVGERTVEIRRAIAEVILGATAEEWDRRLSSIDVCYSPVNEMADVAEDPQLQHREVLRRQGDGWSVAYPAIFSGARPAQGDDVPAAGEGNAEMFGRLGLSAADLADLAADGTI